MNFFLHFIGLLNLLYLFRKTLSYLLPIFQIIFLRAITIFAWYRWFSNFKRSHWIANQEDFSSIDIELIDFNLFGHFFCVAGYWKIYIFLVFSWFFHIYEESAMFSLFFGETCQLCLFHQFYLFSSLFLWTFMNDR